MTARALHARLLAGGFKIEVIGTELVIEPEPPPELDVYLRLLHTGVRSVVTMRAWYGSAAASATRPWVGELSVAKYVPENVGLLAVAGDDDGQWDRLPTGARHDHPEVFERSVSDDKHKAA